jgi:hypothetical protein
VIGDRAHAITDHGVDPRARLFPPKLHAANGPAPRVVAVGPQDQPATSTVREAGDSFPQAARMRAFSAALRLPEVWLVVCFVEERLDVLQAEVVPRNAKDRHRVEASPDRGTQGERSSPTPLGGEVVGVGDELLERDCAEPGDRERPRQAEHKPSGIRTEFIPLASCTSRARIARCLCPASALPNPTRGDNAVRRSGKRRIAAADCRNP